MKYRVLDSPNQSQRLPGAVRLVVCHTPEGTYAGATSTIMNPSAKVSYHRLIKKDGSEVTIFVPWHRKAWHALTLNSVSDGIAIEGHARHFDLEDDGVKVFAKEIAHALLNRGLLPQWTTDVAKGGFCRHGDLQSNRTDPTPDLAEWRVFVGMVQAEYQRLGSKPGDKPWPIPVPKWFWEWAKWHFQGRKGKRPASAPVIIPLWAWRRLKALRDVRV